MFADPTYDRESPEWRTLVVDKEGEYFPWSECLEERRCSVCFGILIKEWSYDRGTVLLLCNHSCIPAGGHVSKDYVEWRWAEDEKDWELVSKNYPELAEQEEALWGS